LGREFSKEEISDIVAFLKTLTGKLNSSIAAYPEKFPD